MRMGRLSFPVTLALGVALALAGSAALAGCGGGGAGGQAAPLVLTTPWKAGEVTKLEMRALDTGAVIGSWELEVAARPGGGGWVLTTRTVSPQGSEVWTVEVGADLLPVSTGLDARDGAGREIAVLKAVYGDGKVVINARSSGKDQPPTTVKLPAPPYFDNEEVVAVLRCLPLADGLKVQLDDIVTRTAAKRRVQATVTGKETVTVPAGTFECWVLEFTGLGQKAWIAAAPPNQLVRYENTAAKVRSVLVEYTPGP